MTSKEQFIQKVASTPGLSVSPASTPKAIPSIPTAPKTLGGFVGNVGKSAVSNLGGIVKSLTSPVATIKGVTNAAAGGIRNLIPDKFEEKFMGGSANTSSKIAEQKRIADALGKFYKDRYGSAQAVGNTLYSDPVGAGLDLATILSGGAALAGGAGKLATAAKLGNVASGASKVASGLTRAAEVVDPIRQTLIGASKVAEKFPQIGKLAPFAKNIDKNIVQTSKEANIKLPASAISTSPSVGIIETLAGKGILGQDVITRFDKAVQGLDDFAQKIAGNVSQGEAGSAVIKGIKDYKTNFLKTKTALYDKALLPAKNAKGIEKLTITPSKSLAVVQDLLASAKNSLTPNIMLKTFYNTMVKKLGKKNLNAIEVRQTIADLNKRLGNRNDLVATGDKGALTKLVSALSDDLDTGLQLKRPELAHALNEANTFYKTNIEKLNSTYGKAIQNNINNPEKILDIVIKSDSADNLPDIYKMIGADATSKVQSAFINDLITKARNTTTERITGSAIQNSIKRLGEATVKAALTPEQFESLSKVSDLADALAKSAKVAEGSQTAFTGRLLGEVGLLFANPILGVKALLGDALFSKWIGSPVGQRFLTEGVQIAPTAEGLANTAQKTAPLRPLSGLNKGLESITDTPSVGTEGGLDEEINRARGEGADASSIIQAIIQQNPSHSIASEIQRALNDGADPESVLQAILAQNSPQAVPIQ